MKLTKSQLKQIIKEEISKFMEIKTHSYEASGASKKGVFVLKTISGYVKGDNGVKFWKSRMSAENSEDAERSGNNVVKVDLVNKASREGKIDWSVDKESKPKDLDE